MIDQAEIHRMAQSEDVKERREALYQLRSYFAGLSDKEQAWEDLHILAQDRSNFVRLGVTDVLSRAFPYIPDKGQAWDTLHNLTLDAENFVRGGAVYAIGIAFPHIPDKKHAWEDLIRLTRDIDRSVRQDAARSIGVAFPYLPNKNQAWEYLHRLTQSEDLAVRLGAVFSLGVTFSNLPDKQQAWEDLHRLMHDRDFVVRWGASDAISSANFLYIPDKIQAISDLHILTQNKYSIVRRGAARTLGAIFPYIKGKKQALEDLQRLTHDKKRGVRISAFHSLGRIDIFRATEAKSEEEFRKQLENALNFFEKSSKRATYFNPASFCFPFYRAFYAITFKKQESEEDMQKYLTKAKSAVEGSESKEKLLEAVENLANALKEVLKARDFKEIKCDLNAYMKYCERAADLLDDVEVTAPGAAKLIRKGIPIIDERIKKIIGEIQEKAKVIFNETKDTPLKEFGLKTCKQAQDLSLQDPLALGVGLGRMIETAKNWCEYIKQEDKKKSACEKLKSLGNLEILEQVIVFAEVFEYISKSLDIPRIQTVNILDTQKEVVGVAVVQFCYELTKSFPPTIKNKDSVKSKIFSGLDIAKQNGANIICLPELCLCEEWIPEIENKYPDIIVIGGGFYKDSINVCPVIFKSNIEIPMQPKLTPSAFEDSEMWETGMVPGDRIYKYETQFGKFVILICRDFENLVHYFRDTDVDFIFCPAFNLANDRFHQEANNHVTKTPSYILIANTGVYGGTSIFAPLNKNYFDRLVGDGCKDQEDLSYKLCEAKKGKEEVIIADFNLIYKAIQIPTPSESSKEKRSVTRIKKMPIP